MKITVITADSAQRDPVGKVHALGLNWSWVVTPTPPMSVVIVIDPDTADELLTTFKLVAELIDANDEPATFGRSAEPLRAYIDATADEPSARMMLAFNVAPGIPLSPGRYSWRVTDSDGKEYGRTGFEVRPNGDTGPAA
ncbi:hypothetical protein [Nocardia spumae]|uniref:hypothetical protein n=1 Tax=Nocardia spumae TaxID=2887190 RepID=UPI001D13BD67|nr:hypothetical protein [Nocardia spumae]